MQTVTPIDIEAAIVAELAHAMPDADVHASPTPPDVGAGHLVVQTVGAAKQTPVSDSFDLVIYAFETTYGAAMTLGTRACTAIRALETRGAQASAATFTTSEARPPYDDPDPDRPNLRRVTVRAVVGARGIPII